MKCLSSISNMRRAVLVVCPILVFTALGGCNLFKVIDPNDPGFDIEKFNCLDYSTNEYLLDVFRKYFPLGSDQQYVEEVLIEQGGCRKDAEGVYVSQQHHAFSESDRMANVLKGLPIDHFAVYHVTYKKPIISMNPGGSRPFVFFYNNEDKLLQIIHRDQIIF